MSPSSHGRAVRAARARQWLVISAGALAAAALLTACGSASAANSGAGGSTTITVYNGQHPELTAAIVSKARTRPPTST